MVLDLVISVIKYAFQRKKILFSFELECVHTHGACVGQKNPCSDTTCFTEVRSLTAPGVRLAAGEHIRLFTWGWRIQTQVFILVPQVLLPTELFPKPSVYVNILEG